MAKELKWFEIKDETAEQNNTYGILDTRIDISHVTNKWWMGVELLTIQSPLLWKLSNSKFMQLYQTPNGYSDSSRWTIPEKDTTMYCSYRLLEWWMKHLKDSPTGVYKVYSRTQFQHNDDTERFLDLQK